MKHLGFLDSALVLCLSITGASASATRNQLANQPTAGVRTAQTANTPTSARTAQATNTPTIQPPVNCPNFVGGYVEAEKRVCPSDSKADPTYLNFKQDGCALVMTDLLNPRPVTVSFDGYEHKINHWGKMAYATGIWVVPGETTKPTPCDQLGVPALYFKLRDLGDQPGQITNIEEFCVYREASKPDQLMIKLAYDGKWQDAFAYKKCE